MTLRPYQAAVLDQARSEYRRGARGVLLVMPTGSGKTKTASRAVAGAAARGARVLWLADRRELVDQAAAALRAEGLEVGVAMSGAWERLTAPVIVALVDSLRARPERRPEGIGFVVLDECHMGLARKWLDILDAYPEARRLGLTATPERSDGSALGNILDAIVVGPSIEDLTAEGHLVPCTVLAPSSATRKLAADPVDAYLEHGEGRPGFLFLRDRESSREAAARLCAAGIRAAHVDGGTARQARSNAVRRFRGGQIDVLCNVEVFTKGFDAPRASVAVLARPTKLNSVYLQQVGRVLRPAPGKSDALVLDLVGATTVLGHPAAPREYSLEGEPIKLAGAERVERTMTCRRCFAVFAPRADRTCVRCGTVIEVQRLEVEARPLARVDPSWRGRHTPLEQKVRIWNRMRAQALEKGHKPAAARYRYRGVFGEDPPIEAGLRERMKESLPCTPSS